LVSSSCVPYVFCLVNSSCVPLCFVLKTLIVLLCQTTAKSNELKYKIRGHLLLATSSAV
jgi:hypothetical protein